MYFYRLDNDGNVLESWADDDGNGGRQSRISVMLSVTGNYQLLIRAYNSDYPGTSDLYKNGSLFQSSITLAGNIVYVGNLI